MRLQVTDWSAGLSIIFLEHAHTTRVTMDEPAKNSHIGLCLLCGLPGAGKSTLARQLKNRHNPFSVVILSYDDVMADVAFKEDSGHEYRDASRQTENQGGREVG